MPFAAWCYLKEFVFLGVQFVFLCNPQESGASRVCITLPQITQKILTEDIINWLELITEILNLYLDLHIFSVRKTTT